MRTSHRLCERFGHMFLLLVGFGFGFTAPREQHISSSSNSEWEAHLSRSFDFVVDLLPSALPCPTLLPAYFVFPFPTIPIVWGALWFINFKYAFGILREFTFPGKHAVCFVCLFIKIKFPISVKYDFYIEPCLIIIIPTEAHSMKLQI